MKRHAIPQNPPQEDKTRVTEVFKALSDPIRLDLVLLLSQGEANVVSLVETLGIPQSTVSRHLATLRHAKLIKGERQGTRIVYRIADSHLGELLIEAFSHAQHEHLKLSDHSDSQELSA